MHAFSQENHKTQLAPNRSCLALCRLSPPRLVVQDPESPDYPSTWYSTTSFLLSEGLPRSGGISSALKFFRGYLLPPPPSSTRTNLAPNSKNRSSSSSPSFCKYHHYQSLTPHHLFGSTTPTRPRPHHNCTPIPIPKDLPFLPTSFLIR